VSEWCHGGKDEHPTVPLGWGANILRIGGVMGQQHLHRYRHLLEVCNRNRKSIGRAILLAATLFGSNGPASAITAEVAKKCRELAILQAHPPQPAGTIPYGEAERSYFRGCVNSSRSLESEPPPSKDADGEERGFTLSRTPRHTVASRRHHRRGPDRLALWGRNPAYPLLNAASYEARARSRVSPWSADQVVFGFDAEPNPNDPKTLEARVPNHGGGPTGVQARTR
jgi:hypothetical protein